MMYKKLLLIFVSIIAVNFAKAQTEKGNKSLGLQFGISTSNSNSSIFDGNTNTYGTPNDFKQRSYSVAPNYNYFIADKLDIGVGLGYTYSSQTNDNTGFARQDQSGYFGTIQLRKYFLYDNKIGIRTGPYVSYQRFKQSYNYYNGTAQTDNDTQSNIYTGGLGLDLVYYPLKRLGLAATMGNLSYNHQNTTGDTKGTYNNFNLSFVNALAISVNYVFAR